LQGVRGNTSARRETKSISNQALSERAQNKLVYEREMMAIVYAGKVKTLLMHHHFVSLILTEQQLLSEEQFRMALKLIWI
jgi:hypothetical protein